MYRRNSQQQDFSVITGETSNLCCTVFSVFTVFY